MEKKTVHCPLCQKQIDGDKCFDISMVAEDNSPERFLPGEIKTESFRESQKQMCLKCKYHPK